MSSPAVKTKLVLYAPRATGAVDRLKTIRSGLKPEEVTDLLPVELEGPTGMTFDYHSKMQLKGQPLSWTLFGCDGHAHSPNARQTLLKGATGILLWPSAEGAADIGNLESTLIGDFDYRVGKNYALGVVTADGALGDAAKAKGCFIVAPSAEPAAMLKELMKAALKLNTAA
jgi:hypothetical protein